MILVLGTRGVQEHDDTALAGAAIDHVARHHRFAHRDRPRLKGGFWFRHQGLAGIGQQQGATQPHEGCSNTATAASTPEIAPAMAVTAVTMKGMGSWLSAGTLER
ncbi:hypothetical protein [Cypionkella sp. TWP1-2-1b2]|uniref:hypothetical protein n=1 Tax=Cypionkella sp. TWP1-2-1b2 TaxID=2804675 RepID=UPI003CF58947